jgi:hypothetical protein
MEKVNKGCGRTVEDKRATIYTLTPSTPSKFQLYFSSSELKRVPTYPTKKSNSQLTSVDNNPFDVVCILEDTVTEEKVFLCHRDPNSVRMNYIS